MSARLANRQYLREKRIFGMYTSGAAALWRPGPPPRGEVTLENKASSEDFWAERLLNSG